MLLVRPVIRLGSVVCALGLALGGASCRVDDVDYEGKLCNADAPCPGDFSCTGGACCKPRFTVTGFEVAWKTPEAVRLSWTPPENARNDFVKYVVVIAPSDSELRDAEQQALAAPDQEPGGNIRTDDDNPELGEYELRLSSGTDEVSATSIDGLKPGEEYRVKLLSFDSAGCAASTRTVVVRTDQDSLLSYVVFDDAPHPGGEPRPQAFASFASVPGSAFEGTTYVDWPGSSAEGEYELIGVTQLNASMNADFPTLDFSTAFLEAAVALEGNPLIAWGEARLLLGPASGGCASFEAYHLAPYAFRSGSEYRVIQIPLAAFVTDANAPLTPDDLATRPLCEVSFGQSFASGQGLRVDAVRFRW